MTEKQLIRLYTKFHRAKTNELESITKSMYFKSRDLTVASDVEFCFIMIASCNYFWSQFIADILKAGEINYKLGVGYKSIYRNAIKQQKKNSLKINQRRKRVLYFIGKNYGVGFLSLSQKQ